MTYHSPTEPWRHQAEYPRRLARRPVGKIEADVFALLCEMGTGKSKMILDEWGQRVDAGELDNLLIAAPAGSYRNWFEGKTVTQKSELDAQLDPALRERIAVAPWISGARRSDTERLEKMLRSRRPRVLVVNVEALSTVERARVACRQLLSSGRTMMVIDESTRIKGDSSRTEACQELGELAVSRRIMSGLVAPRDPLDLFHQYWFLDWRILGHRSFWSYRARYAVMQKMMMRGKMRDIVVGFRNQEELQERIAPWSYRVLLEECLDMPGQTYQFHDVELTPVQRRMIRELLESATTQLSEGVHVTKTIMLSILNEIDKILLGWTTDEEGRVHAVPTNRYRELAEVLGDHSGKAIIWTSFQQSVEATASMLRREYGEKSTAVFYGPNKSTRHLDEQRFLGDPECRFMVSTPAAGGVGNTWNVATLRVYLNNSHDLEHRLQSEKRNYRGGQTRPVTSVDLVCRECRPELRKIQALRDKIDISSLISGDGAREWLI